MKNFYRSFALLCIATIVLAENQYLLNLMPTKDSITVGNTKLNTISGWSDEQSRIELQQSDPILQPRLLDFKGSSVVGFLPKSYLNQKYVSSIQAGFKKLNNFLALVNWMKNESHNLGSNSLNRILVGTYSNSKNGIYISTLMSIFNRVGINTAVPFSIMQQNHAITLQYEYDTKCLGFYWRDQGVQVCNDKLTTEVGSTNNVVLVFASIEGRVLSLQVGDTLIQRHVAYEFDGVEGSVVLGGSTQIHSPFFGLLHYFQILSEPLSDFDKYSTVVQSSVKYDMNLGIWSCWQRDETYSQNIAGIFSYGGEALKMADSSHLHVEEVDALVTSSSVPASLFLAHTSVSTAAWKQDEKVAGMYWLTESWKFRYNPGTAGAGQVRLHMKNLPSISINGTVALCFRESLSSVCKFSLGNSSFEPFLVTPLSGYYSIVVLPCNASSCAILVISTPSQSPLDSTTVTGTVEVPNFIQSQLNALIALIVLIVSIIGFITYKIIRRRKSAAYSQVIALEELD